MRSAPIATSEVENVAPLQVGALRQDRNDIAVNTAGSNLFKRSVSI
jgi:hypothetical protein